MNYSNIKPILYRIPADRQGAKRHFGVHPYFTRRPYNVIRQYILRFTDYKDLVLDPFGGSGVTAIEAFLENRCAIHNDINPLGNFITGGIYELHKVKADELKTSFLRIENNCKEIIDNIKHDKSLSIENYYGRYSFPSNIRLPANSDVEYYYDLFSPVQLISLAILKTEIDRIENYSVKQSLLLAWSATLSKLNKTFISSKGRKESRGGSSIFSIYRYKVAKEPVELDPWNIFYDRFMNIMRAHKEIKKIIDMKKDNQGLIGKLMICKMDIDDLVPTYYDSIDYILTDPPYGGNISYLDLSLLWNNWLGDIPDQETMAKEIIVGGQMKLSEEYYIKRLHNSVKACFEMLKDNRWLSIIFQHWNTDYFDAILSAADKSKAELKSAVSQVGDPILSMHKKKGKSSVLAGEFILTFHKRKTIHAVKIKRENENINLKSLIDAILNDYKNDTIYGEYLLNMIVLKAWKHGIIESIKIEKEEFNNMLYQRGWNYDQKHHYWARNNKINGEQQGFQF